MSQEIESIATNRVTSSSSASFSSTAHSSESSPQRPSTTLGQRLEDGLTTYKTVATMTHGDRKPDYSDEPIYGRDRSRLHQRVNNHLQSIGGGDVDDESTKLKQFKHHSDFILSGLELLKTNKILCDVTLIAEKQRFDAHKVILASCSDYFRSMFTSGMRECTQNEIELKGVSARGLEKVIEIIYSSSTTFRTHSELFDAIAAATHLQCLIVIDYCERHFLSRINCQNFTYFLHLARLYGMNSALRQIDEFIVHNLAQIIKQARMRAPFSYQDEQKLNFEMDDQDENEEELSEASSNSGFSTGGLKYLSYDQLLKCLMHNDLQIREIDLFMVTWHWIKETLCDECDSSFSSSSTPAGLKKKKSRDRSSSKIKNKRSLEKIRNLIRHIRFALISPHDIVKRVQTVNKLMMTDKILRQLVINALNYHVLPNDQSFLRPVDHYRSQNSPPISPFSMTPSPTTSLSTGSVLSLSSIDYKPNHRADNFASYQDELTDDERFLGNFGDAFSDDTSDLVYYESDYKSRELTARKSKPNALNISIRSPVKSVMTIGGREISPYPSLHDSCHLINECCGLRTNRTRNNPPTSKSDPALATPEASRRRIMLTSAPSMLSHMQCVVIDSNFMYVLGGCTSQCAHGESAINACHRYDPRLNKWTQIASMLDKRAYFYACALYSSENFKYADSPDDDDDENDDEISEDKVDMNAKRKYYRQPQKQFIYAFGGKNREGAMNSMEKYDINENKWQHMQPLASSYYAHAGCVLDNVAYISGGYSQGQFTADLHVYLPDTDQWETLAAMNSARGWHSMCAAGGRLYVFGGCYLNSAVHLATPSAPPAPQPPQGMPHPHHMPQLHHDQRSHSYHHVYHAPHVASNATSNAVNLNYHQTAQPVMLTEYYTPSIDQWTIVKPIVNLHKEACCFKYESHIYVMGGYNIQSKTGQKLISRYDFKNDLWQTVGQVPVGMTGVGCCILDVPWHVYESDAEKSEAALFSSLLASSLDQAEPLNRSKRRQKDGRLQGKLLANEALGNDANADVSSSEGQLDDDDDDDDRTDYEHEKLLTSKPLDNGVAMNS